MTVPASILAVFGAAAIVAAAAPQTPTFRAETQTVAVYATVQDGSGRLVPDLDREAFRVFVDGEAVDLVQFSPNPQPLSVALMIDTSEVRGHGLGARTGDRHRTTRHAIDAFIGALEPADRVRVGTFGLEIAVGANLTRDAAEIERVLREEVWLGGGTPLWQALVAAMESLAAEPGRRVVLALTNGMDTGRLPGFPGRRSNIDEYGARTGSMVYAVRIGPADTWATMTDDLKDVALASGGGYFEALPDADLGQTFARVAEELRHQYLIGFVPAVADGQLHRLEVVAGPGLTVRARRSFLAPEAR